MPAAASHLIQIAMLTAVLCFGKKSPYLIKKTQTNKEKPQKKPQQHVDSCVK